MIQAASVPYWYQSIPATPIPPGNCGKFVRLICPRGKVLADFVRPGGRTFAIPWVTPKLFTHTWFPTQNPDITKCEGKYWKHEQTGKNWLICQWQEKTCRGFQRYVFSILCMYFFIAYQVITYIELHSEIRSYQRESMDFFFCKLRLSYTFRRLQFLHLIYPIIIWKYTRMGVI